MQNRLFQEEEQSYIKNECCQLPMEMLKWILKCTWEIPCTEKPGDHIFGCKKPCFVCHSPAVLSSKNAVENIFVCQYLASLQLVGQFSGLQGMGLQFCGTPTGLLFCIIKCICCWPCSTCCYFLGHRTLVQALCDLWGKKREFTPHFSCVWHIHVRVRKYLCFV